MNNQGIISLYTQVAEITHQMLMAARLGDWDSLVDLETRCAAQASALQENDSRAPLMPDVREQKFNLIKKILADDKEIRDLTQPRLAKLSALISNSGTQRKLNHAYNAGNMG